MSPPIKPAPAIVPPGEESNGELTAAVVRKHLEAIVGISRADRARGEKAWGRITGFRAADETHAWVLQQFKAAGLRDPQTQTLCLDAADVASEVVGSQAARDAGSRTRQS